MKKLMNVRIKTVMQSAAAAAALLSATSALADPALLFVTKNSGFVAPASAYHMQCEVGADYTSILILKGVGLATVERQTRPTVYTSKVRTERAAMRIIQDALSGRLVESTGPTDHPTASYVGIIEGEVVERRVKLYEDLSITRRKNSARGIDNLVEFADANCAVP